MTAEIFLRRPHCGVSWGFRLIGGSDSHLPIIVSKVVEGGVAENAGLEEDVVLERVNNVPTAGLTHAEVNQIILAAEKEVLLTIRRVNLENLILASLNEVENNSEISNILHQTVKKSEIKEEEENVFEKLGLKKEFGVTMILDNNKNILDRKKEEITQKNKLLENQPSEKKWSTFLQKPSNPKPKPKNQSPPVPKSDQYRVIITKQSRPTSKPKELPHQEVKIEEKEEINFEKIEESIERTEEIPMELEINLKTHVTEETEITIEDSEEYEDQMENITINQNTEGNSKDMKREKEEYLQYESSECETISTDVIIENPVPEPTMSLEKQLVEVQKQLQKLAQLPSSIQETLAVVTQQLAHIVNEKKSTDLESNDGQETNDRHETNEAGDNEETDQTEVESYEEAENKENTEEEIIEDSVEDVSDKAEMEEIQLDILSDICEEQEISETVDEFNQSDLISAEQEQLRIDEEKKAKHQLEIQEELNRKKNSTIRPIILPGGRKWVDPDDVVLKVKNPKMTDEKICNTLESFSEVIVGKTKGINFLKYTPPPKNLEYLQRSEVYRLVHGMEPPVRGISLRSEKILSEQDYYTAGGN